MVRLMGVAALAASMLLTLPAFAATSKDKQETCKFGADDQKLAGAARKSFMAKCMSSKDLPRGKTVAPAPKTQ